MTRKFAAEPIKKTKDITLIKKMYLDTKPLDHALFTLGINLNLKPSELLSLKVSQVKDLAPGDELPLKQTIKRRYPKITLNEACIEAINKLMDEKIYTDDEDWLFKGQRGAITVQTLSTKVKDWCRYINLSGNYGAETLRKTWGYHQRIKYKVDLSILMSYFNHPTVPHTKKYLCLTNDKDIDIFRNII